MIDLETDALVLEQSCSDAVETLLQRHSWQLIDKKECTRRAIVIIRAGSITDPTRAAMNAYTLAMYHACSGAEGMQRRNMAYRELHRFLFDHARLRCVDVAEDATQRAIIRVYEAFNDCRKPGAFLAFALQRLRDSVKAIRRHERRPLQSLERSFGDDLIPLGDLLPDTSQPAMDEQMITDDLQAHLQQLYTEFRLRHPRAGKQLDALWLKYIDGLDDIAISQRLGTTTANVHVLRCRAIKKLNNDPQWRTLAAEFGMISETAQDRDACRVMSNK
jgi:RNA polymerase sigma factor (sigma-70 family)